MIVRHRLTLFAVALTALAFVALTSRTNAAERSYSAKASDGSTVTFTLNDAGTALSSVQIGNSAAVGCVDRTPFARTGTLPLVDGQAGERNIIDMPTIPPGQTWDYQVIVGDAGATAGAFSAGIVGLGSPPQPPTPYPCVVQRFGTWAGAAADQAGMQGPGLMPGATYRGETQILGGTSKAGEVTLTVAADGKSIARINLTFSDTRNCAHNFDFTNVAVVDGKMFSAGSIAANGNFLPSFAGITQGRSVLRGTFFDTLCAPGVAQWNATLVTSSVVTAPATPTATPAAPPAPTATPAPATPATGAASFVARPVFSAGGQAAAVFSGGTSDQLEAAAKAAGAAGIWVQDATGAFRLLIVDGPAFINGPFRDAFAKGVPAITPVTLTR